MTDEAMNVLKILEAQGEGGRIEAVRTYPHPYKFKLHRPEAIGHRDVTLSTIDQLVCAKLIKPNVPRASSDVHAFDRFDYVITPEGRSLLERSGALG